MRSLEKEIKEIIGAEVVEIANTGAELIEDSALYSKDEQISVETLEDGTYYVTQFNGEKKNYFREV